LSDKPFLHERDDFAELILIVSDRLERPQALVEKDYWVTHTLWSLLKQGFTVFFKGGTSLSKGYDVIERFSEDLDIKLESEELPSVDWKRETKTHRRNRARYFDTLKEQLSVLVRLPQSDATGED
jgi:predicted nucleotidyltransferase component of viral defense system